MCDATGLSQRRACRLTGLSLSACRYEAQRPEADAHLSERITELLWSAGIKVTRILDCIALFRGYLATIRTDQGRSSPAANWINRLLSVGLVCA